MAYKSGNPALTKNTFKTLGRSTEPMTLEGTANKSIALLFMALAAGYFGWQLVANNPQIGGPTIMIGVISGFIIALLTIFKKKWSPVLAPVYAVIEGVVLGGISQLYEQAYGGIVLQAIALTAGIFLAMLFAYRSGIIRATENFKLGVFAATGGIAIFYIIALGASFFGFQMPLIHDSGPAGIIFSLFVVVIASLNLVVDFDFIEKGVEQEAPKYMEWYASFGLFVTIVWLYLEILRLLAKLRR